MFYDSSIFGYEERVVQNSFKNSVSGRKLIFQEREKNKVESFWIENSEEFERNTLDEHTRCM